MKQIVFVRHAHRDKPNPDQDNGLSEKGIRQTQELVDEYDSHELPKGAHFWSSPKKRCLETLTPMAKKAAQNVKIEPLLDEQSPGESRGDFIRRLEKLMMKVNAVKGTVYLCSHGDLIPEAIDLLTGKSVEVKKAQAILLGHHTYANKPHHWELL